MPTVLNKSERLINTHDGTMMPPGVATEISDEALANETIAQAISDGLLENTSLPAGTRQEQSDQSNQQQPDRQQPNQQQPNQQRPTQQQPQESATPAAGNNS